MCSPASACSQATTTLRQIPVGRWFRFAALIGSVEYRHDGEGWYGRPYSGGPWHQQNDPPVTPCTEAECTALDARFETRPAPRLCDYCESAPATGYVAAYKAHVCRPCYADNHGGPADMLDAGEEA